MFDFIAQIVGWGVLPTGLSGGAPPLWADGAADMVPLLWGADGMGHTFWQESYSYVHVDSTFICLVSWHKL